MALSDGNGERIKLLRQAMHKLGIKAGVTPLVTERQKKTGLTDLYMWVCKSECKRMLGLQDIHLTHNVFKTTLLMTPLTRKLETGHQHHRAESRPRFRSLLLRLSFSVIFKQPYYMETKVQTEVLPLSHGPFYYNPVQVIHRAAGMVVGFCTAVQICGARAVALARFFVATENLTSSCARSYTGVTMTAARRHFFEIAH